jgi:hypothetical protein
MVLAQGLRRIYLRLVMKFVGNLMQESSPPASLCVTNNFAPSNHDVGISPKVSVEAPNIMLGLCQCGNQAGPED